MLIKSLCAGLMAVTLTAWAGQQADFGNSSSGGGASSSEVEFAVEQARMLAEDNGTELSVDFFLYALLDDRAVRSFLKQAQVNVVRLSNELEGQLSQARHEDPEIKREALRAVLGVAKLSADQLGKKFPTVEDYVGAILLDGSSNAAAALRSQGLTAERALEIAAQIHAEQEAERERARAELERKLSDARSRGVDDASEVRTFTDSPRHGARRYVMRVEGETADKQVQFKAAISRDGFLELLIEETPFEIEFVASKLAILIDSVESSRLNAELFVQTDSGRMKSGSFGGESGAFFISGYGSAQKSGVICKD